MPLGLEDFFMRESATLQGIESEPKLLINRAKSLANQLRKFGYNVQITPANRAPA
jgi:hypothetical protein